MLWTIQRQYSPSQTLIPQSTWRNSPTCFSVRLINSTTIYVRPYPYCVARLLTNCPITFRWPWEGAPIALQLVGRTLEGRRSGHSYERNRRCSCRSSRRLKGYIVDGYKVEGNCIHSVMSTNSSRFYVFYGYSEPTVDRLVIWLGTSPRTAWWQALTMKFAG